MSENSTSGRSKLRVALVFGGRSSEHAVSCVSAGSVLAALDRDKYDVVPVGISREGRWVLAADDPTVLAITDGVMPAVTDGEGVVLAADPTRTALTVTEPGQLPQTLGEVDVVFPLLHGPYGEDGTIQGLLELAGVPYVGSGVFASAAGMDKGHMKALFTAAGLPIGSYEMVTPRQWRTDPQEVLTRIRATQQLPVFVKPCRAGSSMGITKVKDWDDLEAAIVEAGRHDPRVLVETGLVAREIECGVLEGRGGAGPEVSVCAEVRVKGDHEWYDFEAKYLDDATELDVPADIPPRIAERIRELAAEAFDVLGGEGLARMDFFLTEGGDIYLNEINTLPGFTPASVFPRVWAASGLDYPTLVDRLLQTALARPTGLR